MARTGSWIAILAALALTNTACWDFNNPAADEWDVQIVGDSVFDLSGDIHTVLNNLSGKSYKDRSVSGAKIAAVDNQLGQALSRPTLNTVIADGGANDILLGSVDCDTDPLTQACLNTLDYIADTMFGMMVDMYFGPSDDHVWLGYYHVKGSEAEKNEAIDYAHDVLYADMFDLSEYGGTTISGTVPGYGDYEGSTLGSFQIFVGDPRSSILPSDLKNDDIHPRYSGSDKLANLIWGVMVDQNMYR
ncbi:MAG: hypothetical protein CL910_11880 [Deltaproteobacteria bacterium]|jgi:hypothetical protein|nr:hypothetical protein [Deltaproteobacteria bacterium]